MFNPKEKEDLILLRESLVHGRSFDNQHDALISVIDFAINGYRKVEDCDYELKRLKDALSDIGRIVDDYL